MVMQILYWVVMIMLLLAGIGAIRLVMDEWPFFGLVCIVGWVAFWLLLASGMADEVFGDHPTFTLRTDSWVCTQYRQHTKAPTYVKSGSVMLPVGGGTTNECVQYSKKG